MRQTTHKPPSRGRRGTAFRACAIPFIALLAVIASAAPGTAQTTGRIGGTAIDSESGEALAGVTVTVTSPSLQGSRFAVTDEDGVFRFLALPVGDYTLVSQLDGYSDSRVDSLVVRLDHEVQVAIEMSLGIEDTIVVKADAATLIDSSSTTTGMNFPADLIESIPTSRSTFGIAFQAPGVVDGGLAESPSIGGASAAENRYIVDGLDTTDAAFGTLGTTFPTEFVNEVEIKTGGYEAEYSGALGGVLNAITKSGGNELSVDAFSYFTDDGLQENQDEVTATGTARVGFERSDIGLGIGGALREDKLWYYVGVNSQDEEDRLLTRGSLQEVTETEETLFYAAKLTWQINPSSQLVASTFGNPSDEVDFVTNAYGALGTNDDSGQRNVGLTFNSTLSPNAFLELATGRVDQSGTAVPFNDVTRYEQREFGDNPGTRFLANQPCGTGITPGAGDWASRFNFTTDPSCIGATFAQDNNDSGREELRGSFTWFTDTGKVDHEIKVGALFRNVDYVDDARYPGPAPEPFVDNTGFVVDPTGLDGQRWLLFDRFALLLEYQQDSVGETEEHGLFFQDQLRIGNNFTLSLGVRADAFESTGGGFDPARGEFVDVSQEFPNRKLDFGLDDTIAPRVGFTWDATGEGRSKLYGHYGNFYESVPLDINARAFGTEIFQFYYFYYPSDGSLPTANNPGTWFYSYPLGVGVGVSSDIEAMYTTETVLGFEYGLNDTMALGVQYTDRGIENVIEDISVDGGTTYFITNPSGTFTANPVTGEPLDSPAVFPEPARDYQAIEVRFHKLLANNWRLHASYVNSQNEGNYGGLFRQDNGQLDPNITSLYDLPDLLDGAFGLLPNDREHQFKISGTYLTPFDLSIGWFGQFLSGTPISKLGAHRTYGNSERFVQPRGSAGRTPDTWDLDLHLEYPIKAGKNTEVRLIADIFNVTDQQKALTVDQDWTFARLDRTVDPNECGGPGTGRGTACPSGNPNWGEPTLFQSPRSIRVGVKITR